MTSPVTFDAKYKAMLSRDPRFDGRFFVGVKTTGIYCRPICPARPKRANVEFFSTALGAERSGYRPCLRCRPESAPHSSAWTGTSALVSRALKRIATGERMGVDETAFAEAFGVSARHLRRLFNAEVGKSPKQIADDQRLGFARQLVVESKLPFTQVAEAAGFKSLRRFNSAFKARFSRTPSELRRKKTSSDDGSTEIFLSYRPPFDFASTVRFHRWHKLSGLEEVTDTSYRRLARIDGKIVVFEVTDRPEKSALRLRVWSREVGVLFPLSRRVRAMFDLDSDPLTVELALRKDRRLAKLVKRSPGLRLARGFDPFETSIMTVLGQLVSVDRANRLVADLIALLGTTVKHPLTGEETRLFPTADRIAKSDLAGLGTTNARKQALRNLAREIASGSLKLETTGDIGELKSKLLEIPGIGPWTSEYIALRALGDCDSFPGTDLVLKRASTGANFLDLDLIRPWRSYAAVHLWKEHT